MHKRTEIRNHIVQALREKIPLKIFSGRRLPLLMSEFPCLLVYTDGENVELWNEAPPIFKKTVELRIDVLMTHPEDLDSKIDEICFCVEACLFGLNSLEAKINRVIPKSTLIESSVQGENLIGVAKLSFEITYFDEVIQTDYIPTIENALPAIGTTL